MALPTELPDIVLAIGALGTAAQGLVDASKIGRNGGLSNAGFHHIEQALARFLPEQVRSDTAVDEGTPDAPPKLVDLLHANWINGVKLADQKAAARAGVKLYLNKDNAPRFAAALGLSPAEGEELGAIADLINQAAPELSNSQHNLLGQFDLMLTWVFDEAYQRADQAYRNQSKGWAMVVAVGLALFAAAVMRDSATGWGETLGRALLAGLMATPLAPVSKDLASALQSAVKAIQVVKK